MTETISDKVSEVLKDVGPVNAFTLVLVLAAAGLVVAVLSDSLTKDDEDKPE
jgi:hypothetical protein